MMKYLLIAKQRRKQCLLSLNNLPQENENDFIHADNQIDVICFPNSWNDIFFLIVCNDERAMPLSMR